MSAEPALAPVNVAPEPPHSDETEDALLGSVIIKPALFAEVAAAVAPSTFFSPIRRNVYESMLAVHQRGEAIDVVPVADDLQLRGVLGALPGGRSFLFDIAARTPTAEHAKYYARKLLELAGRRQMIAAAAEAASQARTAVDLAEIVAQHRGRLDKIVTQSGTPKLAVRIVTVDADWITKSLKPREYILTDARTGKGAVDKLGVWMLSAAGGAGKSYASIDLALTVATGGTWFGTFNTGGRPGRVLMVVAEDTAEDVRRRLKCIADAKDFLAARVAGRIDVVTLQGTFTSLVRLDRTLGTYVMGEGLSDLRELIEAQRAQHGAYDLVVIDPIARVAGVSLDKDSEAASKFIDALDVLSEVAGGLVLGVSHTNKISRNEIAKGKRAEATDVRGSTALTDGARGVMQLAPQVDANRKPTGRVVLSLTKGNHVRCWDDVILQRADNGVLVPLDEVDRALFVAEQKKLSAADKQADREARARAQIAADALVVRQVMAKGYAGKLRDVVKSRIGCGQTRAETAIARVKDEDSWDLVTQGDPKRSPQVTEVTSVTRTDGVSAPPPYPPGARVTGSPVVTGALGTPGSAQVTEVTGSPEQNREPGEDDE